jgi:hypothetical protein
MTRNKELGGIEYHGVAGSTIDCLAAVKRLLQFGDVISSVRILSCGRDHCLLLTKDIGDRIAIKSGFASGYSGQGPRGFSHALLFLKAHGAEIDECEVNDALIERLDNSALTTVDITRIDKAKPIRPSRWYDYILAEHDDAESDGTLWREFPIVIPFSIVDGRIIDLALSFWAGPDDKLLKGYRRLEDIVRERTGLDEHGAKLFSKAFSGASAPLGWMGLDDGEKVGRSQLFASAYMAHRNPRAHREMKSYLDEQLAEFLLLNHLYRLEREACLMPTQQPTGGVQ